MAETTESLIWEARARIIWGEKPEKVAEWLAEKNVQQQMIDDIIRVSVKERAAEIRKRGVSEIIIALGLMAAGGAGIAAMFYIRMMSSRIGGACMLGVGYGVFRLGRGIVWLCEGSNVRGSVTGLDE